MIAIDTNILVYAHRADSPFHRQADDCLTLLAEGRAPWAIPWPCIHEFFAIVTHPRIYTPPTPILKALDQIECWLESPTLVLIGEREDHWEILKDLVSKGKIEGPHVHDARIAAICLSHGVSALWSADRDFNRMSGLKIENPLIQA